MIKEDFILFVQIMMNRQFLLEEFNLKRLSGSQGTNFLISYYCRED